MDSQILETVDNGNFNIESFPYSYDQFNSLIKLTISISAISLFASVISVLVYTHMLFCQPKQADRVSLRCVTLANCANIIYVVFDIVGASRVAAPPVCRAIGIIVDFTDVLNGTFLTIIGINLVLIFNIKAKLCRLIEVYYYIFVVLYSVLVIIIPLHDINEHKFQQQNNYLCWFYNHVTSRSYEIFSWLWFYALIFFLSFVGLVCSLAAMIKLSRSERLFSSDIPESDTVIHGARIWGHSHESHTTSLFTKVVWRCILYPSVPFISHLFGFTEQIIVLSNKAVPYAIKVLNIILSSSEGVLIAMVFFSEPAVVGYIRSRKKAILRTYVDEFSEIETYDNGDPVFIHNLADIGHETQSDTGQSPKLEARPATIDSYCHSAQRNNSLLTVPLSIYSENDDVGSIPDSETEKSEHDHSQAKELRGVHTVPMRRISVPISIHSRLSNELRRYSVSTQQTAIESRRPSAIPSADINDEVYIPYRYPLLASFLHRILVYFGHGRNNIPHRRESTNENRKKQSISRETEYEQDNSPRVSSESVSTIITNPQD